VGIECPAVFGDPALLLPLYVTNDVQPEVDVGVVPHWTHFPIVKRTCASGSIKVIDVMDPVEVVARQILSCRMIFATSLHGLIVAEAYGSPAMFVSIAGTRPVDTVKFSDYFESTNRDLFVRHIDCPRRLPALTDEFAKVPPLRFIPQPLLRAFPGVVAHDSAPLTSWSRFHGARRRPSLSMASPADEVVPA
jgi:hypothetical protein